MSKHIRDMEFLYVHSIITKIPAIRRLALHVPQITTNFNEITELLAATPT